MSCRSSFVTEYVYCPKCWASTEEALGVYGGRIPSWEGGGQTLPIMAGKVGGSYRDEAVELVRGAMEKITPCNGHSVTVVVVLEAGSMGAGVVTLRVESNSLAMEMEETEPS